MDTYDIGVAHAVAYIEAVGARGGEDEVFAEHVPVVDIASGAFPVPTSVNIGQGAFERIVGYASVGEGGIDEEEGVAIWIVVGNAEVYIEGVDALGVGHFDIEIAVVVHIPSIYIHILALGIEYFAIACSEK